MSPLTSTLRGDDVTRRKNLIISERRPSWSAILDFWICPKPCLGPGALVENKAKKIGEQSEQSEPSAVSGEGEGATEPGDMPLMPPIRPPVVSL